MSKIDELSLNVMRTVFLMEGILWQGLSSLSKDPDWKMTCDAHSLSGYALFGNIKMLPAEMLEQVVWMGRVILAAGVTVLIWHFAEPIIRKSLGV